MFISFFLILSVAGAGAQQEVAGVDGSQPVATQAAAPTTDEPTSWWERYEARVTATQNAQPHWVTPLVTVTPRLEQEVRTDFLHYYNTKGYAIWNYGNGKGLEFIPEKHTEIIINIPPYL